SLVAANTFGQNTAAIAAHQAEYAEMWAQDATAMYAYAAGSAAATTLTPFTAAPQTTNPAGNGAQAGAAAHTAAPVATHNSFWISILRPAIINAVADLANGALMFIRSVARLKDLLSLVSVALD